MVGLLYGAKFTSQATADSKPHIFAHQTARTTANDLLFDIWNAATSAGRKASVDLDGKYYSAALTAGDILYAVAGGVTGVKRLDSLAIGAVGKMLRSSGTAPSWTTATMPDTVAQGAVLYGSAANVWSALAIGTANQFLRVNAGATAPEYVTLTAAMVTAGAALTKTDDTNVTLTLGGTPTTALLAAASLTLGWTGTLAPARGGTGVANNAASTITITGAFALGLTLSAATSVTLPTSGTLWASGTALTATTVNSTDATDAGNTITGAIKTAGGIGVVKTAYAGRIVTGATRVVLADLGKHANYGLNLVGGGFTDDIAAINFGYQGTYQPGAFYLITTSGAGSTQGDFAWALRNGTTDAAPAQVMWLTAAGALTLGAVAGTGTGALYCGALTATTGTFSGTCYIGDTANTGITLGLTINQGAADNEILALKSSDVAHGMTNHAETDTYGLLAKVTGVAGGLMVRGLRDPDSFAGDALYLSGFLGEAADTTKSTSSVGVIGLQAGVISGASAVAVAADGNLVTIENYSVTRFIFDAEGTLHFVGASTVDYFGGGAGMYLGTGTVGIGVAPSASIGLYVASSALTGANQYGIALLPVFSSAATTTGFGAEVQVSLAAAAFTQANTYGLYIYNAVRGAGSAITNQYGLYIAAISGAATINRAIHTAGGDHYFGGAAQFTGTLTVAAVTASGLITGNLGVTVASGQTLTVTGATVTGLTAASVGAGTFPAGTFVIPTLQLTNALGVAYGGLAKTTVAAFAMLYASAANTYAEVSPNTTTTVKYLRMTGTGAAGQAPSWETVDASHITGTTLGATVVTSSLTTIGTLVAGAVPASLVTAGTFPAGAYTFSDGCVTATDVTEPQLKAAYDANNYLRIGANSAGQTTLTVVTNSANLAPKFTLTGTGAQSAGGDIWFLGVTPTLTITGSGTNDHAAIFAGGTFTGSSSGGGSYSHVHIPTAVITDTVAGYTHYGLYVGAMTGGTTNWSIYSAGAVRFASTLLVNGALTAAAAFGCNGATAQTAYASGGALAGYVTGAFGLDSDAHMKALFDLVVAIRAALVADGVMS